MEMKQIIEKIKSCENSEQRIQIVKSQIQKGLSINAFDENKNTLLMHACMLKDNQLVKFLLENNANRFIENKAGVWPSKFAREQIRLTQKRIESRKNVGIVDGEEVETFKNDIKQLSEIVNSLYNHENECEK